MTKTGMMIGSMGFMAPEQISGRPGPEADIFAWGVTVAYAASGRSPFGAGNTHAVLYRIMYGRRRHRYGPGLAPAAGGSRPGQGPAEPARTAQQLLDRLTSASRRTGHVNDAPHRGDPGADLAERAPLEPAAGQQASRGETAFRPASPHRRPLCRQPLCGQLSRR